MHTSELKLKKCVPCEGGIPKLSESQATALLQQTPQWKIAQKKLSRRFRFKTFPEAIEFVDKVADLAERENHHPDFAIHHHEVTITIWTHAIGGLSENDFILAAKINEINP